jgi:hypothetical protein
MKSKFNNLDSRIKTLLNKIHKNESKLESIINARLALGISLLTSLVALSVWPISQDNPLTYITFVFLVLFLISVRVSILRKRFIFKLKSYFTFLERQKLRQLGTPLISNAPIDFSKFKDSMYLFPSDLGLFDDLSLTSLINETWTHSGFHHLIAQFGSHKTSTAEILYKQRINQSLQEIAWPLIRLRLASEPTIVKKQDADLRFYLSLPIWKKFPSLKVLVLFCFWISWLILMIFADKSQPIFQWVTLSFPIVNLYFLKRWSEYYQAIIGLTNQIEQMLRGFQFIQKYNQRTAIKSEFRASTANSPIQSVKALDRASLFLGTQTNPVLHLVLNAAFPWSAIGALLAFRAVHSSNIEAAALELPKLELFASYAIFDRFQSKTYPEFHDSSFAFEELYHPLINRSAVVSNDFTLNAKTHLVLLTGSNMSGKSTFLRAIGINQLLANMGLPVFAKRFITRPNQIQTCIQVTDSVRDGFSYFYSEVKKLTHINNLILQDSQLLVLVDELFRGTNNSERRVGSRALIKKWATHSSAVTFISSHDLDLALEAKDFDFVECFHFKDDVDPNTGLMHFDYKIHHGPSTSTNALKIMQSEGLLKESDLRS